MNVAIAPWIILLLPLVAAGVILFVGRYSKPLSAGLAIAAAGLCCLLSWVLFLTPDPVTAAKAAWLNFPGILEVNIGFTVDSLSKTMLVLVTSIATLVFIYSIGYMKHEEGYWRYFAGLSLFLFSMLGIVLADNFVMMFIFWELVGVSSYILIGHYFSRNSAAEAAKQAFTVNRIGDFGFLLGILMLWLAARTVSFEDLQTHLASLEKNNCFLVAACVLVFCGTIGKSAQLPLHVWLPNSMEGPTPVSSLLHAATMVAAGVSMLARIFPILLGAPDALLVIAWVGGITCFVAGLMGIQQDDIKRILAYSTISQLGYMVLGIGVAATADAAMFHLFTHAFFKCLLFLCAGSVIVGMHHEQDIWKMGGLKNKMPVTFLLMAIGCCALAGIPPFSGFFSKDLIIEWAWKQNMPLFWVAASAVFLTALYTFRLLFVVFLGAPRSEEARHAHESPVVMLAPMGLLAIPSAIAGWPFIAKIFLHPPHPEGVPFTAHGIIYAFLILGLLVAFFLYLRGPKKDPVVIPFFANRLYIDDLYRRIVAVFQDGLGTVLSFFDRWIVDGVFVRGLAGKVTLFAGYVLSLFQVGNIQAYTFFFGAGVVALVWFLISR